MQRKTRHFFLLLFVGSLLATNSAFASSTMNWTNPSANEKLVVGATNGVDAVVTSSVVIHVVQLYVNGCKMVEQVNDTTTAYLDKSWTSNCPFNLGSNTFTVQALDSSSNVLIKQSRTITGIATPNGSYSGIEDNANGDWIACNQCAGGGGGTPVPASNVTTPSRDTDRSIKFTSVGETNFTGGYGGSYWYVEWAKSNPQGNPSTQVEYVKYDFWINVPSGTNAANIQAIEFETQQEINGHLWNMAWQADYRGGSNQWRTFNYDGTAVGTTTAACPPGKRCWQNSGIPLTGAGSPPAINDGSWHHIVAEFHVDPGANLVYHDALWVDGQRFATHQNNVHNPHAVTATKMTNAFQLDNDSSNNGITSYVDEMSVTNTNQ